jgi:hypothetical protein
LNDPPIAERPEISERFTRAVTRLTARIGVWPTAIVVSIALTLAVNVFATIGFMVLDQPNYSE